jgi:phosphate transport system substrate-binding protein
MKRNLGMVAAVATVAVLVTACGGKSEPATTPAGQQAPAESTLSGVIKVDGSSTVFPITEAVAEEFMKVHKKVDVPVGISGSSGGFKKWVKGEIDINDSSRKIKQSEIDEAKAAGFDAVELPVAYDGLSVVVNKENTFLQCITTGELKKIWDKDSTVKTWNEVNPAWPAEAIKLYGPGTDSGTFEYFTEKINGKSMQSRADYTASEDDNVLVQGVSGNKGGMGYFGYAYYVENADKVRAVAIDGGKGCVAPDDKTIADLSYPISRLIYIYPSTKAMERPEVKEFVKFYLTEAPKLMKSGDVKYTPLTDGMYQESIAKIK